MSKKHKKPILNDVLDNIRSFLGNLNSQREAIFLDYGVVFNLDDETPILLTKEETIKYHNCIINLIGVIGKDQISGYTVEKWLQQAIVDVLDIKNQQSDVATEYRIEKAIEVLLQHVEAQSRSITVHLLMSGIDVEGLPVKIGKIVFKVFSKKDVLEVDTTIGMKMLENLENKVVAVFEVKAKDYTPAIEMAMQEVMITINVINFYSDLVPYSLGWAYFPGEYDATTSTCFASDASRHGAYNIGSKVVGPLGTISIEKLLSYDKKENLGFRKACIMLSSPSSKIQVRIIAGLHWAGRATIEKRLDISFLSYMIALESVILFEGKTEEISCRLRNRVACILESDPERRSQIVNDMKQLYAIRSRIVHNGYPDVTCLDVLKLSQISKRVLIRLLTGSEFEDIKEPSDLLNWFNRNVILSE